MNLCRVEEHEEGRTGAWSWPKFWGAVVVTISPAPLVLWYLEIGPDMPWWGPMVITLFVALLGVGLHRRALKGVLERLADAGADRLGGGA